jgi:alkylhydroperoxidase family enzyme
MSYPATYSSAISISLPPEEDIERVIGKGYNGAIALNVIKMMAGTEDMYSTTVGFIDALFRTTGVNPRTREMIMLRAAKVLNSPYEWQANVALGKNIGLTTEEIEAAACDGPVTGIDPEYVLVCRATDELSTQATLTDATLSELLSRYGDVVSRKLILMIGWFNLLSRFLNGCRVPLEVSDKIGYRTSPLS